MQHLPEIKIKTVPHKNQRYNTAGDYDENKNGWWIKVSEMEDWRYESMCVMHELMEMILTKAQGVDWKDINYFDMEGEEKDMSDPGLSPRSPYHSQHMAALRLEKEMCKILGIPWYKYDNSYKNLKWK